MSSQDKMICKRFREQRLVVWLDSQNYDGTVLERHGLGGGQMQERGALIALGLINGNLYKVAVRNQAFN
jgi:hypothetical protein